MSYVITKRHVPSRLIAAVRARMPIAQVPSRFVAHLDEVYATVRREHIANEV